MHSSSVVNENEKQSLFETCQMLADNGDHEQALTVLESIEHSIESVMNLWLKGRIYFSTADKMAKSFRFKYYATPDMKLQYQSLLNVTYDYLYKAAIYLPAASTDTREYLNKYLWVQLSKVENEIAKSRIIVDEENLECDYDDDLEYIEQQKNDILINNFVNWSL